MSETTIKPPARIEPLPLRVATESPPAPTPAPNLDRQFRLAMLRVGTQLSALLVAKGKLPEELASDFSVNPDLIKAILVGDSKDLTVAQLQAFAKVFDVNLVVRFEVIPPPPTPPSAPTKT
jgi:hypothetical protein